MRVAHALVSACLILSGIVWAKANLDQMAMGRSGLWHGWMSVGVGLLVGVLLGPMWTQ